jgi:hypothetical protein
MWDLCLDTSKWHDTKKKVGEKKTLNMKLVFFLLRTFAKIFDKWIGVVILSKAIIIIIIEIFENKNHQQSKGFVIELVRFRLPNSCRILFYYLLSYLVL